MLIRGRKREEMTLQDILDKMIMDDHVSIYSDVKCICYHVQVADIKKDLYYRDYLSYDVICIFGLVAGTIGISIRKEGEAE